VSLPPLRHMRTAAVSTLQERCRPQEREGRPSNRQCAGVLSRGDSPSTLMVSIAIEAFQFVLLARLAILGNELSTGRALVNTCGG
jgi:hypothetical protein